MLAAIEGGAENNEDNKKGEEEEEEPPIDMTFPAKDGWQKILLYLISFPIMAPLYVTLPDTKNRASKCHSISKSSEPKS